MCHVLAALVLPCSPSGSQRPPEAAAKPSPPSLRFRPLFKFSKALFMPYTTEILAATTCIFAALWVIAMMARIRASGRNLAEIRKNHS